ncbi:MAG: hypothetical protein EOP45_13415 [Sphingobacteriaceae bacterium]|nr:MAG: hypothetical protein EOP45_13415 [Sphingobacteriaceae bacterium]
MAQYNYKAINNSGRTLKGSMVASNEFELEDRLMKSGLHLVNFSIDKNFGSSLFSKVTSKELILFCIQIEQLDKAGVSNYIKDYFKNGSNNVMANVKWKVLYYSRSDSNNSNNINDLLRYYLLSTDFFLNQMDVSKPVNYIGIFDPYKSPIANPYSYILLPKIGVNN